MFTWLSNRLRRKSNTKLEQAPKTSTVSGIVGMSPRRGVTLRPFELVRFENRRRTRAQRVARRINR